ncbi:ATP-dependent DNA helicase RecG [Primorskyibacter sp. S187A]|uniref:ATP-dependent DNA helicase RecG n=1 Tax=Primorskyibacter sp. S187A TaxID=3415130 RepID=UPI003C7E745A
MTGRPEALFPLFSDLESLPAIGPKSARALENLHVRAPVDLLYTLPHGVIDRRVCDTVDGAVLPATLTVEVTVGAHRPAARRGGTYRVNVADRQIGFQLVWFRGRSEYLQKLLPEGSKRLVSGKVELFDNVLQMVHPDFVVSLDDVGAIPPFEPIYPLTAGITQKAMFKATQGVLSRVPHVPEWIDPTLLERENWPTWEEALRNAHRPEGTEQTAVSAPARRRLAYDEVFAHQITMALARQSQRAKPGISTIGSGALRSRVLAGLPYRPTGAQDRAMDEIADDMARAQRMNRLLQGDVGAGKTLVAFMALLVAVEAGGQGALMAPTEILARQHLESLKPLADEAGVVLELLTGRDKGAERRAKLSALAEGDIQILVGTHAVFQNDVIFADLRLAIVDEQHRFGVRQRLALGEKGQAVDVLVMTATPIPRSLALAQYGDMDVSILDEKPPGRKPIQTALLSIDKMDHLVARLRASAEEGRQAYWVCPLVDESEVSDLTAAEERFKHLRAVLGEGRVGLVHGQMPPAEKDAAMAAFQAGETSVLVATTVIEVGVNVPNATIMIIERAETFGLAQLHQLRGRVGRGDQASTCMLLYKAPLGESGQKRLETLRETEDGFRISEVDLEMRGAGDMIGTAQSGLPRFRVADLEGQPGLMALAQSDARNLLSKDPTLDTTRGEAVRHLLWLMRQDESIRLISVG